MSSVDDRIVNMQFNNKQFTQGAADSKKSLDDLEKTLANTAKSSGLDKMGSSVDKVTGHFSAMRIAGISAVATIASKATLAGIQLAKSLSIGPIMQGFHEYETNLNSIQTILANTGLKGNKGLAVVNKSLAELNRYSDQTIYNFSQMASAIGRFTAAGVKLGPATSAIKGMANVAALTGANAEDLNRAMYQTSQALSAGTIKLMDWKSLENANMGTSNVKKALMETAKSMNDNGVAMDAAMKKMGNFRDSLSEGWLSADIFTKTMKVMAGQAVPAGDKALKALGMTSKEFAKSGLKAGDTVAYTVEQLKKMGYSDAAAKKLHDLSQASIDSATKIKTFSQMVDVIKESIGSGWAKIFQDLFGNFKEATNLWTSVGTSITDTIGNIFGAVDTMLLGWKKLGGYQELWTAFGNIFQTIGNLFHPLIAMFQAIAPSTGQAGKGLYSITHAFLLLSIGMEKASGWLSDVLTPAFVAVGGVIRTMFSQIGRLAAVFAQLTPVFNAVGSAAAGMVQQGMAIASGLISGIVAGLNPGAIMAAMTSLAQNIIDSVKSALGIASPASTMVPIGVAIIQGIVQGIAYAVPLIFQAIGFLGKSIIEGIGSLFKGVDAAELGALLNVVLTGALLVTLNQIGGFIKNFTGIGKSIRGTFDQLTGTLKTMQTEIRAKMLMEIAIAVGILTASLIALSLINPKKMASGLTGITVLLGDLMGVLLGMSKINGKGAGSLVGMSTSLLILSAAMIQFAIAVKMFSTMSPEKLATGLTGLAGSLALVIGTLLGLSLMKGPIEGAAGSILVIAFAMTVLAGAVLAFGNMSVDTIVRGLTAMAFALALMVGTLLGLSIMAGPVKGAAASILVIAAAMVVLSSAVLAFGNMSIDTLVRGITAIAFALGLFVGAVLALSINAGGTLAAAASMAIMAAALASLVPVILALGNMSMETLVKGIAGLAATLTVFVVALTALGIVAYATGPALLVLGAALALIGIGMAAFGTGFALLAATGTAGIAVMTAAITAFIMLLPNIAQQMALAFVAFMKVIANASGPLRKAFGTIFVNMLGIIKDNIPKIVALVVQFVGELIKGVTTLIPKFGKLLWQLITTGIGILRKAVPQFIKAGLDILVGFLKGIRDHIGDIVSVAGDIIVRFIRAVGAKSKDIVDAAGHAILDFLNGIDAAIVKYSGAFREAGARIIGHLIDGMTGGLASRVKNAVGSAIGAGISGIKGMFGGRTAIDGRRTFQTLADQAAQVVKAAAHMANAVVAAGSATVAHLMTEAGRAQGTANTAAANAELAAERAKRAAKEAAQAQKEADKVGKQAGKAKKGSKQQKQLRAKAKRLDHQANLEQQLANQLERASNKAQRTSDKAQAAADKQMQKVQDQKDFEAADTQGKGDIMNARAQDLASRASKMLAKANAEAALAKKLSKSKNEADRKFAEELRKAAREDAKRAKELADNALRAHEQADQYYATSITERIQALQDAAAYEAGDNKVKAEIRTRQAKALEDKAEAARIASQAALQQAQALAATNAAAAQAQLAIAEQQAQIAQDAADQAKQYQDEAAQLLGQASSGTNGGIQPSRTAMEDAAKAVDRYTVSLAEASALAAGQAPVVQFVQNNTSPVALSASEIYRQSRNLLSTAEVKIGALTP